MNPASVWVTKFKSFWTGNSRWLSGYDVTRDHDDEEEEKEKEEEKELEEEEEEKEKEEEEEKKQPLVL